MRKQDAVYWPPAVADGFGRQSLGTPVDVKCRWDDQSEQFFDPKTGVIEISNAVVYVDQDVLLGGYLWLGTVATIPGGSPGDPQIIAGAYPIRKYLKNPNLRASEFLRTATL